MSGSEHHEGEYFLPEEFLSDDFFAESDEENPKTSIMGTSPQSTLSGIGSFSFSSNDSPNGPSQAPSPPSTPFRPSSDDALDLLYSAVGQVERLNLYENPTNKHSNIMANFYHYREELMKQQAARFYQLKSQQLMKMQRQQYANAVWDWQRQKRSIAVSSPPLPPSERPPIRNPQGLQPGPAIFVNGGVRRQSNGTGVFLPRRVSDTTEPKKKNSKTCSPFLLPARVVQALNLNAEDTGGCHSRMAGCYVVDGDDALMGQSNLKRNLHHRQRRQAVDLGASPEISLPQEWTY